MIIILLLITINHYENHRKTTMNHQVRMVIFPGARFHAAQLRPGRSDEAPLAAAAGHRLAGGPFGGLGGHRDFFHGVHGEGGD